MTFVFCLMPMTNWRLAMATVESVARVVESELMSRVSLSQLLRTADTLQHCTSKTEKQHKPRPSLAAEASPLSIALSPPPKMAARLLAAHPFSHVRVY